MSRSRTAVAVFPKLSAASLVAGLTLCLCAASVNAEGTWSLLEENDGIITKQDRHYTQGLEVSYLTPELKAGGFWDREVDAFGAVLPMFSKSTDSHRRFELIPLGDSLFTPDDLKTSSVVVGDRPYDSWLFAGASLLQENAGRSLNELQFLGGVTGKEAAGKEIQNGFHSAFGFGNAKGWDHQLGNRAAFQLSYDYKLRLGTKLGFGGLSVDAIPGIGGSVGTTLRYGEAGLMLRIGNALKQDYGPERMRPALSGSAYRVERGSGERWLGYYIFASVDARYVGYNRFIDGSSEVFSPGLERKDSVYDVLAGVRFLLGHRFSADVTVTRRSKEYTLQPNADQFGSIGVSYRF